MHVQVVLYINYMNKWLYRSKVTIGETILLNSYDNTNNLTLFSEKLEHVSIADPCGTLKVNGGHLGNATICGISEKCCLCFYQTQCKVSQS